MYGEEYKYFIVLWKLFFPVWHVKSDTDNQWKPGTVSEHWLPILGSREYEDRTPNYGSLMCTLVLPFPGEDAENQAGSASCSSGPFLVVVLDLPHSLLCLLCACKSSALMKHLKHWQTCWELMWIFCPLSGQKALFCLWNCSLKCCLFTLQVFSSFYSNSSLKLLLPITTGAPYNLQGINH